MKKDGCIPTGIDKDRMVAYVVRCIQRDVAFSEDLGYELYLSPQGGFVKFCHARLFFNMENALSFARFYQKRRNKDYYSGFSVVCCEVDKRFIAPV